MTKIILIGALLATTSVHAETYHYVCGGSLLTVSDSLLTFRGKTYPVRNDPDAAKWGVKGRGVSFSAATQGVGDLRIGGKHFDCDMARSR